MKPRVLASILVLSASLANAAQSASPKVDFTQLQDAASFRWLGQPELEKLAADSMGAFAAPGDLWAPTDVLPSKPLPRRRLIWVAQSNFLRVMHYEQGGFAHTYHVSVGEIDGTTYKPTWYASTPRLRDYADFLSALNAGDINPQPLPARH